MSPLKLFDNHIISAAQALVNRGRELPEMWARRCALLAALSCSILLATTIDSVQTETIFMSALTFVMAVAMFAATYSRDTFLALGRSGILRLTYAALIALDILDAASGSLVYSTGLINISNLLAAIAYSYFAACLPFDADEDSSAPTLITG